MYIPLSRGVLRDVEVDNLAPLMPEHQEHVQYTKGGSRDGEEVDGHELLDATVRDSEKVHRIN